MAENIKDTERQDKAPTIKSRVRNIFQRIHHDKLALLSPEQARLGEPLVQILHEIQKFPDDLERWSHETRERYPHNTEVTLVGLNKDGALLPPRVVPLRRPEVFLKMYETYLAEETIPEELISDDAEAEGFDEYGEFNEADMSEDITEFHEYIEKAKTFDKLIGIQNATKTQSTVTLKRGGVLQALDAKAEQMILDEIAAGTEDKFQLALTHLNAFTFSDPAIGDNLRVSLEALKPQTEILQMQSNVTDFEERAAAAKSIEDLAVIAKSVPENETRVRKSIDNLTKTKFIEACQRNASIDGFKNTLGEARRFPFSDSAYGEDVRFIVEARAKSFILGEIKKGSTTEELDAIEEKAREFRFTHDENLTDINNEIVIRREGLRGNPLSFQQLSDENTENVSRGLRGLVLQDTPTGRSNEPTRGLPAVNSESWLRRIGRFLTNQNPNQ